MGVTTAKSRGTRVDEVGARRRVYLASKFARQPELQTIARDLEAEGYEVTSRWLNSPGPLAEDALRASGPAAEFAQMDFEDLTRADICIAFTEEAGTPRPGRGGRHAELGIALGLGLKILLVGPREHVFHCLPGIEQFAEWDDARRELVERATRV